MNKEEARLSMSQTQAALLDEELGHRREAEIILDVRDLSFAYPGQAHLLEGLNFHLHRGDYVGLIGANGAGKSTLVRLLLGLLEPLQGEILFFGAKEKRARQHLIQKHLAYVPQRPQHWNASFPATCAEIVAASLYRDYGLFRWPGRKKKAKVEQALAQVGLAGFEKRMVGELSGGELQRVQLAQALITDPALMILDEPTSAVDEAAAKDIEDLLSRLNREQGMTLLMVSHDLATMNSRCHRLLCLGMNGFFEHNAERPLSDADIHQLFGRDLFIHRAFQQEEI